MIRATHWSPFFICCDPASSHARPTTSDVWTARGLGDGFVMHRTIPPNFLFAFLTCLSRYDNLAPSSYGEIQGA